MKVQYTDIAIIPDNDQTYFRWLEAVIESVDSRAAMNVTRGPGKYHFRIIPSNSQLINAIIMEITSLSTLMGISLELSKSAKSSSTINFQIIT